MSSTVAKMKERNNGNNQSANERRKYQHGGKA
jgi:hypothetical protein